MMLSSTERLPSLRTTFCCTSPAVMHLADVLQEHGGAVDDLDRDVVQRVDRRRRGVGAHDILRVADLGGARRQGQVLRVDRVDHVERRQALGDSSLAGSRSTMIWRYLPPDGVGRVTPGIGASCWRTR